MIRTISWIFPVLLLCSFSGGKCTVQYTGIYTASVDNETDAHIRFYDDGTVLVSTSVKNIKDVSTWFTKENSDRVLKGKYKIKGCSIRFEVKGDTGKQSFSGTISGDDLIMDITNGKSKASTSRTYHFIAI
jgi:hypothetical protein